MFRTLFSLAKLCICVGVFSPIFAVAQSADEPLLIERLTTLEERLKALERENAKSQAENVIFRQQLLESKTAAPDGPAGSPDFVPPSPIYDSPQVGQQPLVQQPQMSIQERLGTYYDNGFVLVETPDKDRVPFRLQFNLFNQLRYLNQELDSSTFTDHLGNVHSVDSRNDINVNRNLYYFGGYVFDPKFIYNIIIWSSNSVATVIQGGYIGYQFDKSFTLYGGYWGIPGSRTNTRNFMFLEGVERSMADSFFRPGFTQGIWAEGQLFESLNYVAYVGNSANTLNVSTSKIDRNLIYASSVWWEPLGDYNPPGAYKMAFSDLEYHESAAVRIGSSFVGAREDRFTSSSTNNPENVALYNSDGVLFFSTGALAPGVTVDLANFYMWAQDFGFKYRGFAFNAQNYLRWLNAFRADGPLPINSTFDYGFEASAGYFVIPKTFELYGRASAVTGQFRNSSESAGGFNWHPWKNRGFRVIGEVNHVNSSPTASIQTTYNAGMSGWNFVLQTQLYF